MVAEIINGKDLAQELRMSLKDEVTELKQKELIRI